MLAGEETGGPTAGLIAPYDLVHEVFLTEDIVQHQPELGTRAPVHVQVQAPAGGEEGVTAHENGTHPLEIVRFGHVVPKEGDARILLPLEGVPGSEGRVQVDQLDLAAVFRDQLRQLFFGTGQEKGPGSTDVMMLRFAIDPH